MTLVKLTAGLAALLALMACEPKMKHDAMAHDAMAKGDAAMSGDHMAAQGDAMMKSGG